MSWNITKRPSTDPDGLRYWDNRNRLSTTANSSSMTNTNSCSCKNSSNKNSTKNSISITPASMSRMLHSLFLIGIIAQITVSPTFAVDANKLIPIPNFSELKAHYPGYARWGGAYHNHQLVEAIGCDTKLLLHDTSALRMSVSLNAIGGVHSLGRVLIRLSKYGRDSVIGRDGLQYMYHPIAYGPYIADKYGYPTVSKLHQNDPIDTKKNFWGKQGVLRVITYMKKGHMPKGHVALWDCNHFHQARDWIAGHSLITVEFWESPDSDCSTMPPVPTPGTPDVLELLRRIRPDAKPAKLRHHHWEKRFFKKYLQVHKTRGTYDNIHYKNIKSAYSGH